jgi:hypothetical protein
MNQGTGPRKKVSAAVAAEVMIACRRRCCLCAFLDDNFVPQQGQLAHIDRENSHSGVENLVYLCTRHHDEYDTKPSATRKVTELEIRHAQKFLHAKFGHTSSPGYIISIKLDRVFDEFTDAHQKTLLSEIHRILKMQNDLDIKQKQRGCVRLTFELNNEDTHRFTNAFDRGELTKLGITDVYVDDVVCERGLLQLLPSYSTRISVHAVPERTVQSVISEPDVRQHFLQGTEVDFGIARWSLYTKRIQSPIPDESHTILVHSMHEGAVEYIISAFRVYDIDVNHRINWKPIDILRSFLDVFGVDEDLGTIGKRRLFFRYSHPAALYVVSERSAIQYVQAQRIPASTERVGQVEHLSLIDYDPVRQCIYIEVAYAIAETRYGESLRSHGLEVPARFFTV